MSSTNQRQSWPLPMRTSLFLVQSKPPSSIYRSLYDIVKAQDPHSIPAKNPTPAAKLINPIPHAPPATSTLPAEPVKFISPVPDMPVIPPIGIPEGIDMTDPSGIVIRASVVAELLRLIVVEIEAARAATG
ncbi:hypothetical protein CC86DRAFT_411569 [Ophiobolus disseminans]|uniref:Uncharacterized protein n=1 Tax=Ophiobolus disseminans TaxID=1469910 RepID=A0A6A6ZJJ8_9PLEO|nr:hypothetical protein CC86DRAFT_411569 [Ophiobolus disseminans]